MDIAASSRFIVHCAHFLWLISIWTETTADRVGFVGGSAKDEQRSCSMKTHLDLIFVSVGVDVYSGNPYCFMRKIGHKEEIGELIAIRLLAMWP